MSLNEFAVAPRTADPGLAFRIRERDRIRAVQRYHLSDTPPDETYQRIAALIAHLVNAPTGLICIVDSDRVWPMAHHGLVGSQFARDSAVGEELFLHDIPWLVRDARLDQRTRNHPMVAGPFGLRFYAGAPLVTNDGYNLGSLCAIDKQPHHNRSVDIGILQELAALVMHEMEVHLEIRCALKMDDTLLQRSRADKRRAEYLAKHDELTGLGNRRKLDEAFLIEVNRLRRHGGNLCLCIADLDHFKKINDSYGHVLGDEVLSQFGELLSLQSRPTDTAARMGGEEFVVLMPHTRIREALGTAERLRTALMERKIGPLQKPMTVSIGVAELREGEARDSLLQRADIALYRAKRSGRNRVVAAD